MRVRIDVEGEPGEGLELVAWIQAAVPADSTSVTVGSGGPKWLGAGDLVQTLIADTSGIGGLVMAVATWRDARRHARAGAPRVVIKGDGVEVVVDGCDPAEVEALALRLTGNDGSGSGQPEAGAGAGVTPTADPER